MKAFVVASCLLAACHSEENLGFTTVGQPRWAVSLGDSSNDRADAIAIDSAGHVLVAGDVWAFRDIGGTMVGAPWPFVSKRAANDGAELWRLDLVGADTESGGAFTDVAIGPQDTVIVIGSGHGTIDVGARRLSMGSGGFFIAVYTPSGEPLSTMTMMYAANISAVAVGEDGRLFVTGTFASTTLRFNTQEFIESDGDSDAFVAAFDADGSLEWGTAFQASPIPGVIGFAGPYAQDIALAANGDVLVAGTFGVPASFGGAVIDPESVSRLFLTRLRSDGSYVASQAVGLTTPMASALPEMVIDSAGRIVIQHAERDLTDPSTPETSPVLTALRVFDDSGSELWSSHVPNRRNLRFPSARTVASTPDGLIISSAWTDDPLNATDGSMEVFAYDAYGAEGMATFGARLLGAQAETVVRGTAVSATGAIAFTGNFSGAVDFGTGTLVSHNQETSDVFIVMVDRPAP